MNCKPGDLAVVLGTSVFAGRLVEVLYAAPQVEFQLPDGYMHDGCGPNCWVLRSLGSTFSAPTEEKGFMRVAMYVAGPDARLRPLRGDPKESDVETGLEVGI